MTQLVSQLFAEALRLPKEDRADLVARLLETLEPAEEAVLEAGWGEEIRTRVAELDSGSQRSVPWPEARKLIMEDDDAPANT